jgi:hypothetical protein
VKNSNFIGGQLNLTAAAICNLKFSSELSVSMGASVAVDAVYKMTLVPLEVRERNLNLTKSNSVDMSSAPLVMNSAGIFVIC